MQSFSLPPSAKEVTLPSSPLIEYIRLGLEHQALPLSSGQPHPSAFPLKALGKAAKKGVEELGERFLRYGSNRGIGPLRKWILEWVLREGICAPQTPEKALMLVPGCQSGFDLICQAFLSPGDTVALDAPCYPDTWCTAVRRGGRVLPVPVDDQGLDVGALEESLKQGLRPRLVYTVPTYQNPRGCSLEPERCARLLALAETYDFHIVLDDPYRFLPLDEELRRGADFFPWYGWETQRIIWMSSFSKIIAPGLRSAWIIAPEEIIRLLSTLQEMSCISLPVLSSLALFEYLREEGIDSQLLFMRQDLAAKRHLLLKGIETSPLLRQRCTLAKALGGTFLSLFLPPSMSASSAATQLTTKKKIATIPEKAFWPPEELSGKPAMDRFLRISYSWIEEKDITPCIRAFEEVIGSCESSC